jgi:hypothetical protein
MSEPTTMPLVGMVFRGYCGGIFGRDHYGEKRVESVGADWLVVRLADGSPSFAHFIDTAEMCSYVGQWSKVSDE